MDKHKVFNTFHMENLIHRLRINLEMLGFLVSSTMCLNLLVDLRMVNLYTKIALLTIMHQLTTALMVELEIEITEKCLNPISITTQKTLQM